MCLALPDEALFAVTAMSLRQCFAGTALLECLQARSAVRTAARGPRTPTPCAALSSAHWLLH
jgi:hypothetical protein